MDTQIDSYEIHKVQSTNDYFPIGGVFPFYVIPNPIFFSSIFLFFVNT